MKLYYSPGACSLSPHIVLRESGVAVAPVRASTKTHKLQDGTDFYSINPLGYVPLLELDDGSRLREGPAIVQYIADQVPEKKLAPANGSFARYQPQEWLTFIGTELHKGHSPLFNPSIPEEVKQGFRERLVKRFEFVNGELAKKPFLMGEQFSVADAYLYTVSRWGAHVKVDTSGLTHLAAFRERMAARPAVQAAIKAEGLPG